MGYFIRVLGKKLDSIPLDKLREVARPAVLHISDGDGDAWERLTLSHKSGREIALIEKNPVIEGRLGADELREFIGEVPHYKPKSAATWLQQYLISVKVIYAFQLLSGTDIDDGWTRLQRLYSAVWEYAGGILQADGEGFSDEDGFTILWQFSNVLNGTWECSRTAAGFISRWT